MYLVLISLLVVDNILCIIGWAFKFVTLNSIRSALIWTQRIKLAAQYKNQLSFLLPWLSISSIFIDQSLEYLFCISASHIYYSFDYSFLLSVDWILDFSLVILILLGTIWIDLNMIFLFKYPLFYYFIFSSRTTFYVLPFEYFYFFYSNFYFKGMIYWVEVYTGLNSYSLYHIYYYSVFLLLCFFPFILLFLIILF